MKLLVTLFSALAVVSANATQGADAGTDKATRRTLDARMGVPGPDGNVMISYTIDMWPAVVTLDIQTNKAGAATALDSDWVSIGGVAIANAHGDVWKVVMGKRGKIEWVPGRDVDFRRARAVVTAWPLDDTPDFMVFNLLKPFGSDDAQMYYPRLEYLTGDGLWQVGAVTNNLAYRTTSLLFRRCGAFYISAFPVTQGQFRHVCEVAGVRYDQKRFSNASGADLRPVAKVPYDRIRLSDKAKASEAQIKANSWPKPPHGMSWLGGLRKYVNGGSLYGIDFDLPTKAQRESAERANCLFEISSSGKEPCLDQPGNGPGFRIVCHAELKQK